jgi:hypothetical protein
MKKDKSILVEEVKFIEILIFTTYSENKYYLFQV